MMHLLDSFNDATVETELAEKKFWAGSNFLFPLSGRSLLCCVLFC